MSQEQWIMELTVKLGNFLWRPLTASDADTDLVLRLRNAPEAQAVFFTPRITREEHLDFLSQPKREHEYNWIIEREGLAVGVSGMYRFTPAHRRIDTGRVAVTLPELYHLNLVVSAFVAFDHLGLNKLFGDTLSNNTVVIRALERIGAVREAVLREHVLRDGVAYDMYLFGCLARDFRRLKAENCLQFGEPRIVEHANDRF
jgi:RimJ/RimL family protein N-acetyltransferase